MPVDFTGYWKMLANENFEEYLRALGKPAPREPLRGLLPGAGAGSAARALRAGVGV